MNIAITEHVRDGRLALVCVLGINISVFADPGADVLGVDIARNLITATNPRPATTPRAFADGG